MEATIETATTKLLDKLYSIEKKSFQKEAFTKKQIARLLNDYNAISLVAQVNGDVVGFAIGRIDATRGTLYGHILTMETLPTHRRMGIAEKLLKNLETLFREKGAAESRLEVRENNAAAIRLYQKLGYRQVSKLEKYYGDAHGLYLKKTLCDDKRFF